MFVRIATAAAIVAMSTAVIARDYVSIAGSSTVFPFATIVAEKVGQHLLHYKVKHSQPKYY